jgi:AhpC/TSA family
MRRVGWPASFAAVMLLGSTSLCAATDLNGNATNPFLGAAKARVFLFVRTDCPITNRYAPELKRIAARFRDRGVAFWLVYPDRSEGEEDIRKHIESYGFPGTPLRDPDNQLERKSRVTVAPEAAIFDADGQLRYHGRIDDRWVSFGVSKPSATQHDLETALTEVLAGQPVKVPVTRAVGCYLADLR